MAVKRSKGSRLDGALAAAQAIAAKLPPPRGDQRPHRVQPRFTGAEMERLEALAEERGEPVAVTVRHLTIAALDALGR